MAKPPMAATTGLCIPSSVAMIWCSVGVAVAFGVLNSRMSAPPEKALAEPMMSTALTALFLVAASRPAMMPVRSSCPRPLTGGLFSVMTATLPCTE